MQILALLFVACLLYTVPFASAATRRGSSRRTHVLRRFATSQLSGAQYYAPYWGGYGKGGGKKYYDDHKDGGDVDLSIDVDNGDGGGDTSIDIDVDRRR